MYGSNLSALGPIQRINIKDNTGMRIPHATWFINIPILRGVLGLVIQDWKREVAPHQSVVDSAATESQKFILAATASSDLKLYFFKGVFSYVMLFIALQEAYGKFYAELDELNQKLSLQVEHDIVPEINEYIKKIRRIRNLAVAHLGSSKEKNLANRLAGMLWEPTSLGKRSAGSWNLELVTFGPMQIKMSDASGNAMRKSDDFEIRIPEMNDQCVAFLDEYDRVCSDYLKEIKKKLPITVDDHQYRADPTIR